MITPKEPEDVIECEHIDESPNVEIVVGQTPQTAMEINTGSTSSTEAPPPAKRMKLDEVSGSTSKPDAKPKMNTQTCAVADCPPNPPPPMYRFPDPNKPKNKSRIAEWIAFCKRQDKKINPGTARICSKHFSAKCFHKGSVGQLILNKDAVPDRNPPRNMPTSVKDYKATIRLESVVKHKYDIPKPKVFLDSGNNSFVKKRSNDMKEMDKNLKLPEDTPTNAVSEPRNQTNNSGSDTPTLLSSAKT